jgi:hypothetical protein
MFIMENGEIWGNKANAGGGVFVNGNGAHFSKGAGILYGSDAEEEIKRNLATLGENRGDAAWKSFPNMYRTKTVGINDSLDSYSPDGWIPK